MDIFYSPSSQLYLSVPMTLIINNTASHLLELPGNHENYFHHYLSSQMTWEEHSTDISLHLRREEMSCDMCIVHIFT